MKISTLMRRLANTRAKRGDLDVELYTLSHGPFRPRLMVANSERDGRTKTLQIHPHQGRPRREPRPDRML